MFDVRGSLRGPSCDGNKSISDTSSSNRIFAIHSPISEAIESYADSDTLHESSLKEQIFDPLRFPTQSKKFETQSSIASGTDPTSVKMDGITGKTEDISKAYKSNNTSSNCFKTELETGFNMPSTFESQSIVTPHLEIAKMTLSRPRTKNYVLPQLESCLPETEVYEAVTVDFPSSPIPSRSLEEGVLDEGIARLAETEIDESEHTSNEEEEIKSLHTTTECPPTVTLFKKLGRPKSLSKVYRERLTVTEELLNIAVDEEQYSVSSLSYNNSEEGDNDDAQMLPHDKFTDMLSPDDIDTSDELEESIMERIGPVSLLEPFKSEHSTMIHGSEESSWRSVVLSGIEKRIDLKVIEPYKKVLSHGGYMFGANNDAIIVFSACFLPTRSRKDYDYVMDHLFMYVLTTLDRLVCEDYVLVYMHGATTRGHMPSFAWLKRCYQLIDRRLRKNLQGLYLVHPTFWIKTVILMAKPFVSSKFSRKLRFIASLRELSKLIPLDQVCIPNRVKQYDEIRESLLQKK